MRCGGKNHRTRNSKARQRVLKKSFTAPLPDWATLPSQQGQDSNLHCTGSESCNSFGTCRERTTRVGETFSCSTAELPCRRVAGAGLEPATTSVRSCSSSGICPQAAQRPTRGQEMLTYSTRLSYLPANRQGGTRTRDPVIVISCASGAAVIRYKLQATCTNPIARNVPAPLACKNTFTTR